MKKIIVGIFVCTLMIVAVVLPAAETGNNCQTPSMETNILGDEVIGLEDGQSGMLTNDFDWEIIGNNVVTGHSGAYPDGFVGIGTTSPGAPLHIQDTTPTIRFEETDQSNKKWHIGGYNSGLALTETGIADHLYIAAGGNVGIGTISPSAKLDVEVNIGGAATIGSSNNVATGDRSIAMGTGTIASNFASTAMGSYTTASGFASTAMGSLTTAGGDYSTAIGNYIAVVGYDSVGIGLSDTSYIVTSDNVLSIMGGNVGIGTTAPSYLLDVNGGAQFLGCVKGSDAVNDDEFVTKKQVSAVIRNQLQSLLQIMYTPMASNFINQNINNKYTSNPLENLMKTRYTPTGTNDNNGNIGDITYDDSYIYIKTNEGWKRTSLETW